MEGTPMPWDSIADVDTKNVALSSNSFSHRITTFRSILLQGINYNAKDNS